MARAMVLARAVMSVMMTRIWRKRRKCYGLEALLSAVFRVHVRIVGPVGVDSAVELLHVRVSALRSSASEAIRRGEEASLLFRASEMGSSLRSTPLMVSSDALFAPVEDRTRTDRD